MPVEEAAETFVDLNTGSLTNNASKFLLQLRNRTGAKIPPKEKLPRSRTQLLADDKWDFEGVYFIGFRNYVKIGYASVIGNRLKKIQTDLPETLTVLAVLYGATRHEELCLHRHFDKLKVMPAHRWDPTTLTEAKICCSREWFYRESPLVEFIRRHQNWHVEPWRIPSNWMKTKCR